MILIYCANLF